MALCSPRSCGCAIQSESLSITGSGTPEDPLQIEFGLPLPAELLETLTPAGSIRATPYSVADAGWLLFGASYPNANAAYPTLWAKVPTAWKSGTTLVLPTDTDMVLRGNSSSWGLVSGSNTRVLTVAMLPPHTHDMSHDHPGSITGTVSSDHSHGINFDSSTESTFHDHGIGGVVNSGSGFDGAALGRVGDDVSYAPFATTAGQNVLHVHAIVGNTGGISSNHYHGFDVPAYSGNTGNAGSGSSFNVQESGINVRFQIKAH